MNRYFMINTDSTAYSILVEHLKRAHSVKKKVNRYEVHREYVKVFDDDRNKHFWCTIVDWEFLKKYYWRWRKDVNFFCQISQRIDGKRTLKWVRIVQIISVCEEPIQNQKRPYRRTAIIEKDGMWQVYCHGMNFGEWSSQKIANSLLEGISTQIEKYGIQYFHPNKKVPKNKSKNRNSKRRANRLK